MRCREARNLAEGDMDAAYISALSALGGATIGGLVSFGSSWLTQRTQLCFAHHEAIKAKREALYTEFIDEASRLYQWSRLPNGPMKSCSRRQRETSVRSPGKRTDSRIAEIKLVSTARP